MPLMFPVPFAATHGSHMPVVWTLLLPLVVGGFGVYALLPRPRGWSALLGGILGMVSILLAGALLLRVPTPTIEAGLFYFFSFLAVVFGGLLVTQRHPARAALSFAMVVLSTCGIFLLLAGPFLMAATIIIYAGAIIVTFLFVIMLAQQAGTSDADARSREPLLATVTGFLLLGALLYVLQLDFENTPGLVELQKLGAETAQARADLSESNKADYASYAQTVHERLKKANTPETESLAQTMENPPQLLLTWPGADKPLTEFQAAFDGLEHQIQVSLITQDWIQSADNRKLSDLSGPKANMLHSELRIDAEGRPQLPADNSAYLGRSLFTDYLLPVELGGFLLLVATIGAIAIAQRKPNLERA